MDQEPNNSKPNNTDVSNPIANSTDINNTDESNPIANSADANNTNESNPIANSADANNTNESIPIVNIADTNNTDVSDPIVNNTDTNDQSEKRGKKKFFAILKLIITILLFIPAIYFLGMGVVLIFLFLIGATNAQPSSASEYMTIINQIWIVSIIPLILVIILFVKALKSTIKSFVKIDKKKLDLGVNNFFIVFNIVLFFLIWLAFDFKATMLLVISIILLIINIYKKGK
jgi:hypothetical protein